jgi:hypothetical protein
VTIPGDPREVIRRYEGAAVAPAIGAFRPVEQRLEAAREFAERKAAGPLHEVVEVFRRWLYLPDVGPLLALLATMAANLLPGDPVWLLLVAASGGGKTELLGSLSRLPNVHQAATLTEAALLSGTPVKQRAKDARGGLLRDIGEFGTIVCKDFTSTLAQNKDTRGATLAALREVYDGAWTRHVGTDGGRVLHWEGKVGFVGGCTPAIDAAHGVITSMGERFVFYRLAADDDDEQARRALSHYGQERQMRAELATAVSDLFGALPPCSTSRDLAPWEQQRLVDYATFAARSRSAVERDAYKREVQAVPAHEAATRLALTLRRLLAGLERIGADDTAQWKVIARVALDCMPATRRAVLDVLRGGDGRRTSAVALATELPTQTARRALEDLALHGVVHRSKQGTHENSPDVWNLSKWARERWPVPESVPESPDGFGGSPLPFSSSSLRKEGKTGTLGEEHR